MILVFGLLLAFSLARFLGQVTVFGSPETYVNIAYSLPSLGVQNQNFIYGITIAMTSFIGIESIAQAAEETKRPDKWIPRANKLSIISVVIFAVGLSAISMGLMGWQELAAARNDPIRAIAAHIPIIGPYLAPIVAATGFAICYVSTNTGIIGVSRIVFSMGRFDLLPHWFYKVHSKFKTPYQNDHCLWHDWHGACVGRGTHFCSRLVQLRSASFVYSGEYLSRCLAQYGSRRISRLEDPGDDYPAPPRSELLHSNH